MGKGLMALPKDAVFALDIGTRSIIGMLGFLQDGKMKITAIERAEHTRRAMVDGQIEDISQVALLARRVRAAMEEKSGYSLDRVYVAAAGRALRTSRASCEVVFPEVSLLQDEQISRLETGAIEEAQKAFSEEEERDKRFFLVGYTVAQYYLDDYPISSLQDHRGQKVRADIVATFLPGEVVESLYAAMQTAGMEVAGLTLEPIAAMNVAIPEKLRLLNLVMVDIGAGTSDIAVCRDGKVVGYTMATLAGDEITEAVMKAFLVDFDTAEQIKMQLGEKEEITFTDILGFEQVCRTEDVQGFLQDAMEKLAREIADRILEVNAGPPSAVFMAGGGSRLAGLSERITESLKLPKQRASVAGRYYSINAVSEEYDLDNPEYATPLGIVVSAGLNLVSDSFSVRLNGNRAKLFSNGMLRLSDILMMNGYRYRDMIGRSGSNIIVTVNGERRAFYGEPAQPAIMRVNGSDAALSDLLHAGDEITFIPAKSGRPACVRLFELQQERNVIAWRVNGEETPTDYVLKYGDEIVLEYESGEETGADEVFTEAAENDGAPEMTEHAMAASEEAEDMTDVPDMPGKAAGMADTPGETAHALEEAGKADGVTEGPGEAADESEEPAGLAGVPEEVAAVPDVPGGSDHDAAVSGGTGQSTDGPGVAVAAKAETEIRPEPADAGRAVPKAFGEAEAVSAHQSQPEPLPAGGLFVELNGQPMFLPPKADGEPYYLMDLIVFSGLDLKNISAPVILKVNDTMGLFQQEIRDYDRVVIYEDKNRSQT